MEQNSHQITEKLKLLIRENSKRTVSYNSDTNLTTAEKHYSPRYSFTELLLSLFNNINNELSTVIRNYTFTNHFYDFLTAFTSVQNNSDDPSNYLMNKFALIETMSESDKNIIAKHLDIFNNQINE
jgi:hypothetical protein